MFEVNKTTPLTYRYNIEWLADPNLEQKIRLWIQSLKSISMLGQMANRLSGGHVHRRKLVKEFHEVLHCYAYFLDERSEKFRGRSIRADIIMRLQSESTRTDRAITLLETAYRQNFNEDILTAEQLVKLTNSVQAVSLANVLEAPNAQLSIIDKKIQLVNFWLDDLENGTSNIDVGVNDKGETDETGLFLAYLGNGTTEKVRLVLDVLLKDAGLLLKNPSKFKIESTIGKDYQAPKVEWEVEEFKTTVKAEASAFVGVRKSGEFKLECTGLKANFKAEALAGAMISGSAEASWGRDGIEAKAEVAALVGVQITFESTIDIGDIFLLEASAEAFAGALANAKVEFTATVDGVKFGIEAEAFAGARLVGSASVGFKAFGVEIMKGTVEGSLTAGIGAKFKFEFEATGAGGQKLDFAAGLTFGVGAEGEAKLEFNSWNAALAINALYYSAYSALAYNPEEAAMRKKYFRGLENNKKLFEWTLETLENYRLQAQMRYDAAIAVEKELGRIKEIADLSWKPNKNQKVGRKAPRLVH